MGTPTTRRSGARSRIAGVPTVLPPAAQPVPTLLTLPDERARSEPLPGVVHLPGWLDLGEQQALVRGLPSVGRSRRPGCAIPVCPRAT